MKDISKDFLGILGESVVKHLVKNVDKQYTYLTKNKIREKLFKAGYGTRSVNNVFYYLFTRKYIKKNDGDSVALTARGAQYFAKTCPLLTQKKLKEGYVSIVVVEIPEEKREIRDFLRRRLSIAGFFKLGRGVYVSEKEISPNFSFLVRLYGLGSFVLWGKLQRY